jgi:hypothetical protein
MALFETINTEDQMVDYIKLICGAPVINLEVTDDQIKQQIWDSIQDFQRYNYDEGSYQDYVVFTASAGVSDYPMSAIKGADNLPIDNIQDIWDFEVSFGLDGINTLFSPQHILLYDQWVNKGEYPGGPGGVTTNTGMTLASYQISMMYLEEIKSMFGKWYHANWLPGRQRLKIVPTPAENITGILVLYRREYARYLYNHPLVKKLSIARVKIQWGRHLSKYPATLPDGITINGEAFLAEGKEEEQRALENMRMESQPIDFFVA